MRRRGQKWKEDGWAVLIVGPCARALARKVRVWHRNLTPRASTVLSGNCTKKMQVDGRVCHKGSVLFGQPGDRSGAAFWGIKQLLKGCHVD